MHPRLLGAKMVGNVWRAVGALRGWDAHRHGMVVARRMEAWRGVVSATRRRAARREVVVITFAPPRAMPPPRAERHLTSSNSRPSFNDQNKGVHFGLLHSCVIGNLLH